MKKLLPMFVVAVSLWAGSALAQGKGPHGGILGGDRHHGVELVLNGTSITFYLLDDGKVESAKGSSLRAVIQEGSKNVTIPLAVEGEKVVAKLEAPLPKGARVVVTGKNGHGHTVQARFTVE